MEFAHINDTSSGIYVETTDELNARYAAALLPLTVIFAIFTVVGVLGNAGVIVVFSLGRASRNSTFRVFAISLAIVDFLICALLLPSEIAKHRSFFYFDNLALCQLKVAHVLKFIKKYIFNHVLMIILFLLFSLIIKCKTHHVSLNINESLGL